MRLQKFLARSGVASRRGSEALVAAGRVRVNGATVTEMGTKVDPAHDVVEVDGAPVRLLEEDVVLMLHKPLGYVTTMKDDHAHRIVADLVPLDRYPSLFPLGRLDRDTTGLLLFSTDGELGHALLRPRGHVVKRYLALVEGTLTQGQLAALRDGVHAGRRPHAARPRCGCCRARRSSVPWRCWRCLPCTPRRCPASTRARCRAAPPTAQSCRWASTKAATDRCAACWARWGTPWWRCTASRSGLWTWAICPRGEWRLLAAEEAAALGEAVAKD